MNSGVVTLQAASLGQGGSYVLDALVEEIAGLIQQNMRRLSKAQAIADAIRNYGSYRWVGLYDVDMDGGTVSNIAWSGAAAPAYPTFPTTRGLTSRAIASRSTVNVGNVADDADYLTALDSTRSEIIFPIMATPDGKVIGTLDVESEIPDAFDHDTQKQLEQLARALRRFWSDEAN